MIVRNSPERRIQDAVRPSDRGLAIEVTGLRRVFTPKRARESAVVALDDVTLRIERGEVHGLLGPNGAGKTTLVKVLSTVLLPTAGVARVLGLDVVREPRSVRPLIGIVFGGERGLYPRLTARQNLRYWAALYRLPARQARERTEAVLGRVGLAEWADARVETYSRGMKQRLHLARGLIGDPEVLFLDEPTTGMDPVATREFRALVATLKAEGRTILLATHDMAEAETACDRVTLIDRGRLLATESPRTLATWIARYERIECDGASDELLEQLGGLDGVMRVARLPDGTARIEADGTQSLAAAMRLLLEAGVLSVRTGPPDLEEVYLRLLGDRGLRV
jgi:ABC-2 type transport system ATP-binding protein